MSGTSMDGVDASIIKSDGYREYSVIIDKYFEYKDELRQKLINIRDKILLKNDIKDHIDGLNNIEREITIFNANLVNQILKNTNIKIDAIGFHGQTIFHDSKNKITKQLGDGRLLSQLTQKKVIFDFRQNDLKNEGQGAPLTPIFHNVLVNKILKTELNNSSFVIILNIGGISNITQTINWDKFEKKNTYLRAADIGPGNCLIDDWIRKNSKENYDMNGEIAEVGKTDELVLNQALENFDINPPYKESLDIKDFDVSFVKGLTLENGTSTLTDLTAIQISKALNYFSNPKGKTICLICGGGRKNRYLMRSIMKLNEKIIFYPIDKFGIKGDFVESQAFGYLAIRTLLDLPITFPNTTSCKSPTSGGVIVKNF